MEKTLENLGKNAEPREDLSGHEKPAYQTPLVIPLGGIAEGQGQPPCGPGSGASGGGCSPGTGASGGFFDSCSTGTSATRGCANGNSPTRGCFTGQNAGGICFSGNGPRF